MNDPLLTLNAELQIVGQSLHLTYIIRNRSSQNAYFWNRFYRTKPDLAINPSLAIVIFDTLNGMPIARIQKCPPTLAHGRTIPVPYIPLLTPIHPGKEYRERITFAIPLTEWQPPGYGTAPRRNSPSTLILRGIVIHLDYFWAPADTEEKKSTLGKDEIIRPQLQKAPPVKAQTLTSDLLVAEIKANDFR
jgi:hypothetical protein